MKYKVSHVVMVVMVLMVVIVVVCGGDAGGDSDDTGVDGDLCNLQNRICQSLGVATIIPS